MQWPSLFQITRVWKLCIDRSTFHNATNFGWDHKGAAYAHVHVNKYLCRKHVTHAYLSNYMSRYMYIINFIPTFVSDKRCGQQGKVYKKHVCMTITMQLHNKDISLKTPTLVSADVTIRMPITTDKHNNNVHPLFPTNNANVTLTEIIPWQLKTWHCVFMN